MTGTSYPILYSFRRCPYAMRARLAIASSGIKLELREVVLKDKPAKLIELSSKATVPVLQTAEGKVIDESLDIMLWALQQYDPQQWLSSLSKSQYQQSMRLIQLNDGDFKYYLDRYKYADRYPEFSAAYYRQQAEKFLHQLEQSLTGNGHLLQQQPTLADMAILPFIRQFSFVDTNWFDQAPYPRLRHWLNTFLDSELFKSIMCKYAPWQPGPASVYFGDKALIDY